MTAPTGTFWSIGLLKTWISIEAMSYLQDLLARSSAIF